MKLKQVYEYLGDGTSLLNDRADARCPSCCPPDVPVSIPIYDTSDTFLLTLTNRKHPEIVYITDNVLFLMYTTVTASTTIYYRVITLASDLSVTSTAETVLATSTAVGGYHGIQMTDNKIAIVYTMAAGVSVVRVVNFSGTTPTFGATTSLDSTHQPTLDAGQMRISKLDRNKYILAAVNSDNAKIGTQVIDIDNSDVITVGLLYKTVTTLQNHPRLAALSSSELILATSTAGVNVSGTATYLSVSGSVVTFGGTPLNLVGTTIYPSPITNEQFFFNDIAPVSSSTALVIGTCTFAVSGVSQHGIAALQISVATGNPVATTGLFDQTVFPGAVTSPTSSRGCIAPRQADGTSVLLVNDSSDAPGTSLSAVQFNNGDPPSVLHTDILEVSDTCSDPEIISINNNMFAFAYQNNTENLVKVGAVRYIL